MINHVEFVLTAEQYKDTVEVLLTDTRRQTAILMAAFTKPHFNSHTNSSFFIPTRGQYSWAAEDTTGFMSMILALFLSSLKWKTEMKSHMPLNLVF